MKIWILALLIAASFSARAEWYAVTKVHNYNTIDAQISKGGGSKSSIRIRIANLEKIEYITNDRTKVLLGGSEPKKLLESVMLGQIVWIDQLESINGEYVGYVYPSYEQVLKGYMKRRLTGSYTLSPAVKQKLSTVRSRMLSDLRNGKPTGNKGQAAYENEYSKALFIYDSLNWFKKTGQFLPSDVQEVYVDWVSDYYSESGTTARELEVKIQDMWKRHDLYRDFLHAE